ncbi:MAG: hypothetical protein KatS3mg028_1569 [Bacteroidia bacterium]|nr:MAG: hypothetical protein KatS3mg028_1569 [Bacteroidia bacterium]
MGIIAQQQSILATEFSRLLQSKNDKQIKNWLGKLLDYEIIKTKGRTKGTEYFVNPKILKNTGEMTNTSLKHIQEHRLEALVMTDLERFGKSSISEIHKRIGKDIPLRKLRSLLYQMTKDHKIVAIGEKKGRKYFIDKNIAK